MSEPDSYMDLVDQVVRDVVAPSAQEIDHTGAFPRAAIQALARVGLLGLVSARDVGGLGESHRAATLVVERIAAACGSTAMVVCMHYSAAAVIEAFGPRPVREAIARGEHVSTLAFSEGGSRSHFWAPVSTARKVANGYQLDARKSWVTSAGEADSYVWSSQPAAADGQSTIWLVPANAPGLSIPQPFDGLGLRGNCSAPVVADRVAVGTDAMLGKDGGGFDVMMGTVLAYFQLMNAGFAVGTMESASAKSAQHLSGTRLEHIGQSLAELPTVR
ncbi:MAG TPA: acyl-CoA dehydrogenase family protein, partial [Blastocatellia bacterium]|nr:acyl-CoA dehydrogenase family protein [Blastocatellia bacterium]